uniref:Immunoglobulin V-set domain-containing protein n=2 Tax=Equus TaxID=9789 RepID=A0A3Q2LHR8_HORSE|nr:PREDICTED: carcinoembryonic antigen-related cell adhesion molecule 3-like [Equus przewalskii]
METPSASVHRGHVPCQGLLLAVLLSTIWNPPTTAGFNIESVPSKAVVGTDVILLVTNLPQNLSAYMWYKGDRVEPKLHILSYAIHTSKITSGPGYNGRQKIYADGSLLFQNATQEDTGYYTLEVVKRNFLIDMGLGQLHIYKPV